MTMYTTIFGYSIMDSFHRVYFRNKDVEIKDINKPRYKSYKYYLKENPQLANHKKAYELRRKVMKEMMNIKPLDILT